MSPQSSAPSGESSGQGQQGQTSANGDAPSDANAPVGIEPSAETATADAQEVAEIPAQPRTDPNAYNYFNWKGDRVIGIVITSLGNVTDTNSFDRSTLESLGGASSIPGSDYEFYEWEEDTFRSGDEDP
jgi:hypothetical protein